jgi:HD-like signal output (HDOD) protein
MKNWLNRIIGTTDAAAPEDKTAAQPAAEESGVGTEIDATYYRWLTASAGFDAPDAVQARMLVEMAVVSKDPAAASELVPRVPVVIVQLLGSLNDDTSNAELARQMTQDTVLVAEVILEANSAYYRSYTPVKTVEAAIMTLGQNGLRMLLTRITLRPLIRLQDGGFARLAAPQVWNHAQHSARAASLLASALGAPAYEAYLSGLMQNVGQMVALRVADRVTGDGRMPGSSEFGQRLQHASRQLSAAIAFYWTFPDTVCDAIAHAGDPGDGRLAQALAQGDRIAKLRLLVDAKVIDEDDQLVTDGMDKFQRRCFDKLVNPADDA